MEEHCNKSDQDIDEWLDSIERALPSIDSVGEAENTRARIEQTLRPSFWNKLSIWTRCGDGVFKRRVTKPRPKRANIWEEGLAVLYSERDAALREVARLKRIIDDMQWMEAGERLRAGESLASSHARKCSRASGKRF